MFTHFEEIVESRADRSRLIRRETQKGTIGYLCSYVPEEIIYAAGYVPIRILSNEEAPTLSDNYMQSYYCTFARSILHQCLQGDFKSMDGLVSGYSCTTMRLAFDNLQIAANIPFNRFIYTPGLIDAPEAKKYFYNELARFRKDMEDLSGKAVTDDDLWAAIDVYDENRALTREIFRTRIGAPPAISGKEAFLITLSGMLTDKADHNARLKELLEKLPARKERRTGSTRVMIVGSPLDNLKLLDLIEDDLGADVVTDDTCTSTRYIMGETPRGMGDPLEALVQRYLVSRPPCPSKHSPSRWIECTSCPFRDVECFSLKPSPKARRPETSINNPERICRFRHALQLAIDHKVEGVVALIQKFCDPHGFDYHHVAQAFNQIGVPSLFLEVDNIISVGQIKTRVQAFLEMLHPVDYVLEPDAREALAL